MRPHLAALPFAFLAVSATAQTGRTELEADTDPLMWMVLIVGGIAFFHIRAAFRVSVERGELTALGWAALGILAVFFPAARALCAVLTVAWLLYGFWRRT